MASVSATTVENERALCSRASEFPGLPSLESISTAGLGELSAREGVDFATALLFDRVKRSSRHAAFIEAIDQLQPGKLKPERAATIAIVPAAFYKEKPHSGADGRVIHEEALRLGFNCERIPLPSTGTLAGNSKIILDWLADRRDETIVLVSLCKGGADVKFALASARAAACFDRVVAWVNVCGTLSGSPVVQWLFASRWRSLASWLICRCRGRDLQFLKELDPAGPLAMKLELPDSMRLINVVGFPLRHHLSNRFMRGCHRFVSSQGPNDGGVLLAEVCGLPGFLYPIWGADHYLRPESRARRAIAAVLVNLTADLATRTGERGQRMRSPDSAGVVTGV